MQTCRHFIKKPYFMWYCSVCICLQHLFLYVRIYFYMRTYRHKNIQIYYGKLLLYDENYTL